ncbi:hypothetical protein T08_2579 [Trichinella sp. T8]|nr:hypothetical protein T08_2579 [Trichinella sp. T8]
MLRLFFLQCINLCCISYQNFLRQLHTDISQLCMTTVFGFLH